MSKNTCLKTPLPSRGRAKGKDGEERGREGERGKDGEGRTERERGRGKEGEGGKEGRRER